MKLTRATIDTIKLPHGKQDIIVFDESLPGFGLRTRAGGSRNWIVQYELRGHQQRRYTIGSVKVFSPEEARKVAREKLAEARLGKDPQGEKREANEQAKLTLGSIIERYLSAKEHRLRPGSMREIRRHLHKHWKSLHRKPIHTIERRDVAANLGGAPVAAARARSTLSGLFAWAIAEGLCDKNPVVGTRKPDEGAQARDRVLSDIELAAVWRACPDDDYGRIVRLLILLGSRRQEIGGMRWSELDERGAWTLPGARAKNKHALVLPLPSATWGVIRSVPRVADRDHLFSGNAERGFVSWGPAKADLDKKLGSSVAPFKLHDLRRSVATGMCNIGIQPHIVEQILNHRSGHKGGVAGIYNKATYQREVAVALGQWADHVHSIVEGEPRKIISLRS
jgi:integrase